MSESPPGTADCHICSKLFELSHQNDAFREMVIRQQELCNDLIKLYNLLQNSNRPSSVFCGVQPCHNHTCPLQCKKASQTSVRLEPSVPEKKDSIPRYCTCPHEFIKRVMQDHAISLRVEENFAQQTEKINHTNEQPLPRNSQCCLARAHDRPCNSALCSSAACPIGSTVSVGQHNRVESQPEVQQTCSTCYQTHEQYKSPPVERIVPESLSPENESEARKGDDFSSHLFSASSGNMPQQQQQVRSCLKGQASFPAVSNQCNVYIWTITSYCAVESLGCCYWSPSFYLGTPGYRFRAKLEFSSYHMGIFIQLIPGEYDALLPWPFRHIVQFMVIDQTMNGRNLSRTLKPFPEDEDERGVWDRPHNAESELKETAYDKCDAWGLPDFVPRCALNNGGQNEPSNYVRNDRLYVAIRLI
ncbi:TNF receptor-associated factor 4 [Fasciola gigantica]|uniref:TNF receptor-associated factor 4 n=1 Tax=Fasciola gigantica TaxID=46835 RepID=A0A504YL97_FASGI|nr:TNF receptor-associated factor 4 [Fasciola gigantica]